MSKYDELKKCIRTIPDWPKPGIQFRDITTLLKDPEGLTSAVDILAERYQDEHIDLIAGIEARGFIFAAILAARMKRGFIPIRKKGKLPGATISETYALEYGEDTIEIHTDAIEKGSRVLLVDDLIATGGTALAGCKLIQKAGGEVIEAAFVIDLPDLGGAARLQDAGIKVFSMVAFEGE